MPFHGAHFNDSYIYYPAKITVTNKKIVFWDLIETSRFGKIFPTILRPYYFFFKQPDKTSTESEVFVKLEKVELKQTSGVGLLRLNAKQVIMLYAAGRDYRIIGGKEELEKLYGFLEENFENAKIV